MIWIVSWIAAVIVMTFVVIGGHSVGWMSESHFELLANLLLAVFYGPPTVLITVLFRRLATYFLGLQR